MMRIFGVVFFVIVFVFAVAASGHVILTGKNITSSFDDIEANFGAYVRESGISGTLYLAEPLDACSPLSSNIDMQRNGSSSPFALIIRGGCSFEDKARRAQIAGYKAAIVYDNVYGDLVAMAGISGGIDIAAVFVSKASGETLGQYASIPGIVVYILPSFENTASAVMAISFIALLAMSAMLATCFFVRRQHIRRSQVRESHGMSSREVKAMPSLTFTSVVEDNSTSRTCAICLEDYNAGEKLRILPCRHKFHAVCVDAWLTSWRTFCPVCKCDARTATGDPPPSECTPLLTLSSFRSSSSATSSAILVSTAAGSSRSLLVSSSTGYNHLQQQSLHSFTGSRSWVELRNASSQRSNASYLTSSSSPNNNSLRYHVMYPYIPSPGNESSSSFIVSSIQQQQQHPLHYSEPTVSFSMFASAQSLPGC